MPEYLFRGMVKHGKFWADDVVSWAAKMGRLEGKRCQVTVKKETTGRTISQNSYLWGVVYRTLAEWSGHTSEELHEHLKRLFLELETRRLPSGDVYQVTPSTASLSIEEFGRYVDEVVRWAAEQGVYVPAPEEVR